MRKKCLLVFEITSKINIVFFFKLWLLWKQAIIKIIGILTLKTNHVSNRKRRKGRGHHSLTFPYGEKIDSTHLRALDLSYSW